VADQPGRPRPLPDEPAAYLAKARQNLAAAEAAHAAGHYDAAASRAYYAAFQAAVAALWVEGIRPPPERSGTLSHEGVQSEWSGRLVYRRKRYSSELRGVLPRLHDSRIKADYRAAPVTEREARQACAMARALVEAVARTIEG
jgi:uncharacterized protein (UPF0332 family)